jgi:hypothetical protein
MKGAVDFLIDAIDHPEVTLGSHKYAALDLACNFLAGVNVKKEGTLCMPLLKKTMDGFYEEYRTIKLDDYTDIPVFESITMLLKTDWYPEVEVYIIKKFLQYHTNENNLNFYLINYANGITQRTEEIVSSGFKDYFGQDITKGDEISQIIYATHLRNIGTRYGGESPEINRNYTVRLIDSNLQALLTSKKSVIRQAGIWALFNLAKTDEKEKAIYSPSKEDVKLFRKWLESEEDAYTCIRLIILIIKSNAKLFTSIINEGIFKIQLVMDAKKNFKTKFDLSGYSDKLIENKLLQYFSVAPSNLLLNTIAPYLGLIGSENVNDLTQKMLLSKSRKQVLASIIVLAFKNKINDEIRERYLDRQSEYYKYMIMVNSHLCYQVMGKDTSGRTAWYFVLVYKNKVKQFLKHKQGDGYDLADYGFIISSGYGEFVPEDVIAMLKDNYGFDNF